MPKVVHFEITAHDTHRAVGFYRNVFGWDFTKWIGDASEDYWMLQDDGGSLSGGIFRPNVPISGHINTILIDDIDLYVDKVRQAGGEVIVDKHEIPGVGWHAYVRDTEGNVLGLLESNRTP